MSQLPQLTLPLLIPKIVLQTFSETYDWGLRDLNIPDAHKITMGEGIKIALLDSGRSEHFELVNNTGNVKNFTDSSIVEDRVGHSTFCSGLIAAEKNDQGIIGVAPKAKIYFGKAINDGSIGDPSSLVNAVNWAIEQKVDIISISAGMFMDFQPLHDAIKVAYAQNIIIVCAVGNTGTQFGDVAFPARYPECIGVGAYDKNRKVASFSSRGLNIAFSMPGVDIYSTWLQNQYCCLSGTSFACPVLAGVCALILAKHRINGGDTPCNTPKQMLEHLQKYSINLGDKKDFGFGTVNIEEMFKLD